MTVKNWKGPKAVRVLCSVIEELKCSSKAITPDFSEYSKKVVKIIEFMKLFGVIGNNFLRKKVVFR